MRRARRIPALTPHLTQLLRVSEILPAALLDSRGANPISLPGLTRLQIGPVTRNDSAIRCVEQPPKKHGEPAHLSWTAGLQAHQRLANFYESSIRQRGRFHIVLARN